jgi:trimethylamine--corrinoid protein Co-methyltransferase
MTFAALLTQEQVEKVHDASLEILEEVGLKVRFAPARELFKAHGCRVEEERVKFPRAVVEKYRRLAPSSFTFHARDPKFDKTIPQDSPVIVTASSAPDIIDPVTGRERRAESADIARIAHLINELPGYDIFSISTLAEDAPQDQFTVSRLYPSLKYCLKPLRVTTTNMKDTMSVMNMAYMVAGGEEAYKEHPFLTHHYCPIVSPLTMDHLSTENVMFAHVYGGHACTGQCRIFGWVDVDADDEGRYADDLCHARHGGGYAFGCVHVRRDRVWDVAYGVRADGSFLQCAGWRLCWFDQFQGQ